MMSMGVKFLTKSVIFSLCVCFFLANCSSRPHSAANIERDLDATLNATEQAIFRSTGPIDDALPTGLAKEEILRQYKHFLRSGRKTINFSSKRAEKYLAYSRKVFRSRGMPEDLAYLAIVESGYRPDIISRSGALGAWQFMPFTGKKYGLQQDWWLDERLDPYKSVEASAAYLQKLHNDFKDWPTALAAYNCGEGKMAKALQASNSRNFYELCDRNSSLDEKLRLKDETLQYVPRFIAITKIMRNLPELGFDPIYPDGVELMLRFKVKPGTNLVGLVDQCGIDKNDFLVNNRHHRQAITTPERRSFVYVPASHEQKVTEFLQSASSLDFASWRPKQIQSRADTWDNISKRSGVHINTLKKLNPQQNKFSHGDTLLLPNHIAMSHQAVQDTLKKHTNEKTKTEVIAKKETKPTSNNKEAVKKPEVAKVDKVTDKDKLATKQKPELAKVQTKQEPKIHVLLAKETLYSIARQYGVSLAELQAVNNIEPGQIVKAGRKLIIPQNDLQVATKTEPAPNKANANTAIKKEVPSSTAINSEKAKPVALAKNEVKTTNKVEKTKAEKAQTAKTEAKVATKAKTKKIHVVQQGDNLWNIARRHDISVEDLKRLNGVQGNAIRIGSKMIVER